MKFSPLIVGTMRWGVWGAAHSKKAVQKLIEISMQENLTTFDHADIYGDYTTENLFGAAFAEMNVGREAVQFISKCGIEMPCANRNYKIKSYNYTPTHLINSVEQSLANLKTEYLDLLLLHRPSPLMHPAEIAETFGVLKSAGMVREFGVSNFSVSQFEMIDREFPLITNQMEISLNQTDAFFNGTLDQLMLKKLRPMAWSVMGNYFTAKTEQNKRLKKTVQQLCKKYGKEENQILLAFLLKHPAKILPVIGTSNTQTLQKLSSATAFDLEREDWFVLLQSTLGKEVD